MSNKIDEYEKEYIKYNIKEYFKHFKLEERIKKISNDIHKLQKFRLEINNNLKDLSTYINSNKNSNITYNNDTSNNDNILTKSASSLTMYKNTESISTKPKKKKLVLSKSSLNIQNNNNINKTKNLKDKSISQDNINFNLKNKKDIKKTNVGAHKINKNLSSNHINNNINKNKKNIFKSTDNLNKPLTNRKIKENINDKFSQTTQNFFKKNINITKNNNDLNKSTEIVKIKKNFQKINKSPIKSLTPIQTRTKGKNTTNILNQKKKSTNISTTIQNQKRTLTPKLIKTSNNKNNKPKNKKYMKFKSNIDDIKKPSLNDIMEEHINKNNNNKKKVIKKKPKKFSNNYVYALYLAVISGYITIYQKIKIILNNKEIYNNINIKDLIKELLKNIEIEYNNKKNILNKYDNEILNQKFIPNVAYSNGLNFLTKNEIEILISKNQPKEILNIFKIILFFLGEDFSEIEDNNILQYFFNIIYKKYKISSIKELILKQLINNIQNIPIEFIKKAINLNKGNKDTLSPAMIFRHSRCVSYITFIINDLYKYITFKLENGLYLYELWDIKNKTEKMQNKINKLKMYL